MKKSWIQGQFIVVLAAVFAVSVAGMDASATGKEEALKAAASSADKKNVAGAAAAKESALKNKAESMQEAPNMTSKTDQASGSSDDAEANKKVKGLFDDEEGMPNPMESQVNKGAGKSLGVEPDTKGPGHNPVGSKATKASTRALGIESGTKGPGGEPVNPQNKAGTVK